MSVRRIWMIGLLGVWSGLAAAGLPQSGRPLPVGSGDTLGPLAMPEGLRVAPAGAVAWDGAAEPDLLVYAHTGLRRELRRYHFAGYGPAGQPVFRRGEVLAAPWLAAGGNAFFFRGRDGVYGCSLERPAAGQLRRQPRIRGWRYVASRGEFEELFALDVPDSLRPYDLIAIPRADGRCWQLVYSEFIPQKGGFRRTAADRSSYYDGAGVFRNPLPRSVVKSIDVELSTGRILTEPELLTPQPLLGGLRLGVRDGDKTPELVAGNQFGALWQLKPGVAAAPWRDDRGGGCFIRYMARRRVFTPAVGPAGLSGARGRCNFMPPRSRERPRRRCRCWRKMPISMAGRWPFPR